MLFNTWFEIPCPDMAEKVMADANAQIHIGPHNITDDDDPDGYLHQSYDEYKRFGVGEVGYLKRVDQYLDKIKENAVSHFAGPFECKDCSSKKQKGKYPPRANTIRYFDKASELIEKDINKCRIFVSEAASAFHEEIGFITEDNA
jgi:hypothetical protein